MAEIGALVKEERQALEGKTAWLATEEPRVSNAKKKLREAIRRIML